MLPTLYEYDDKILLISGNKTSLFDAKTKYKTISESILPSNILKATQCGYSVVLTTAKSEQYMVDLTSSEVKLSNGTVFFESRPHQSGEGIYAQISGSAATEKIPGINLSKSSEYGDINIAEMKAAVCASEDAFLLTCSEWELYFWRPVNPLPAVFPDYEVIKKMESVAPIKKIAIDAEGRAAFLLTNTGVLTMISCYSDPTNTIISDICCDFVLHGRDIIFADLEKINLFNIDKHETKPDSNV